mgnify:CR=1 FL=1
MFITFIGLAIGTLLLNFKRAPFRFAISLSQITSSGEGLMRYESSSFVGFSDFTPCSGTSIPSILHVRTEKYTKYIEIELENIILSDLDAATILNVYSLGNIRHKTPCEGGLHVQLSSRAFFVKV